MPSWHAQGLYVYCATNIRVINGIINNQCTEFHISFKSLMNFFFLCCATAEALKFPASHHGGLRFSSKQDHVVFVVSNVALVQVFLC